MVQVFGEFWVVEGFVVYQQCRRWFYEYDWVVWYWVIEFFSVFGIVVADVDDFYNGGLKFYIGQFCYFFYGMDGFLCFFVDFSGRCFDLVFDFFFIGFQGFFMGFKISVQFYKGIGYGIFQVYIF